MRMVDAGVGRSVGFLLGVTAIIAFVGTAGCGDARPDSGRATSQALTAPVPLVTKVSKKATSKGTAKVAAKAAPKKAAKKAAAKPVAAKTAAPKKARKKGE